MKKNYLLVMLAAGLLASCSSGLDEATDSTNPIPGNTDDNELMEIQLGNGGLKTVVSRAVVTPDNWIGTEIGVFGLNKLADANWTDNSVNNTATDNLDCILNGVKATITDNAVAGNSPQGVSFGATKFYYPRVSSKAYSFYGYYPYVAPTNADMQIVDDQVTCRYVITGKEDIIWGKAFVASPGTGTDGKQYDGYNAAYFRKLAAKPTNPNISFTHLLTKLTFSLVKGADYKVDNCSVTEVKLVSVPKNGDLIIASKNAANTEGTISWLGTTLTNGTMVVPVNPTPGQTDPNAANITDVVAYNGAALTMDDVTNRIDIANSAIMVPSKTAKYTLSITLNGSPTTIEISPKTGNFLSGYTYNVALTINGPMAADITATLTDWQTGGEIVTEI